MSQYFIVSEIQQDISRKSPTLTSSPAFGAIRISQRSLESENWASTGV